MPPTPISRRRFLRAVLDTTLIGSIVSVAGIGYITRIEPLWVQYSYLQLELPRLHPAFDGYRIIQISDLHADDALAPESLRQIPALIASEHPDLIVITGDFVSHTVAPAQARLTAMLRELHAPDGVLAVMGNHDHWGNVRAVRELLSATSVQELANQVTTIARSGASLHIAGVDDVWERQADLGAVLADLPTGGAAILLAHEPDFADVSSLTERFDLQLSGHSHGGQVNLPFIGTPFLPPLGLRYPAGLYQVGKMWQYTNRGLASFLGVRFNCPPEITVLTLCAPQG